MNFFKKFYFLKVAAISALFLLPAFATSIHAAATLCARVTLRFSQRLTFEREAFEATLKIENGLGVPIEDFTIRMHFWDTNGNSVEFATPLETPDGALFFVRPQDGSWDPATDGAISPGSASEAKWLIIPAPGAAGGAPEGTDYRVGATLTYKMGVETYITEVVPEYIWVRPMPELLLQYFLPGDVPGEDPTTANPNAPTHGEPVPFAVRVVNTSLSATARNLRIESNQPEIIDNQLGLAVDFRIVGSQVNGLAAQPSLLVSLGDIAPRRSGMAWWNLTSTLAGRFISVRGQVTHASELGGSLTSLVEADDPMVRRLLGLVQVDLPGRDAVLDYLATDSFDKNVSSARVFESDTGTIGETVTFVGASDSRLQLTSAGGVTTLSANGVAAVLFYARTTSPVAELKTVRVIRSDGKVLPEANAWISRSYRQGGGWDYMLNVFDTGKQADHYYTLGFSNPPVSMPPEIIFEPAASEYSLNVGQPFSLTVSATAAGGKTAGLDHDSLPAGAVFLQENSSTGILSWTPEEAQEGFYTVRFRASDGTLASSRTAALQVKPGLPASLSWQQWKEKYWPDVSDPDIIGADADADHDGLTNLLEYALDTDPTEGDLLEQPQPSVVSQNGKQYLALSYRCRPGVPEIVYQPQVSDDMFAWRDLDVESELVTPAVQSRTDEVEVRRVIDPRAISETGNRRFIRLVIKRLHEEELQ
jgi:hypothetical protein